MRQPDETAVLSRRDLLRRAARASAEAGAVGIRSDPLLSLLPHMKGVGTVASLQLTHAIRGYRLLVELAFVVLVIALAFHFSQAGGASGGSLDPTRLVYAVIWTTIIISNPLRFDFRGGLHTLEYLKTLPDAGLGHLRRTARHPGDDHLLYQLPFLAMAAQSLTLGLLITVIRPRHPAQRLLVRPGESRIPACLRPANPVADFGDIQYIGRQILMLVIKFAVLLVSALIAVGFALLLAKFVIVDRTLLVNMMILMLTIEAVALIGLLAWVFTRFDSSRTDPHDRRGDSLETSLPRAAGNSRTFAP
jgi:hypothetical protein